LQKRLPKNNFNHAKATVFTVAFVSSIGCKTDFFLAYKVKKRYNGREDILKLIGGGNMFQIGDKIVHPMHGAGVIDSIATQRVNGVVRDYYVLKLPVGGMQVMVPTENSAEIGVRPIVAAGKAEEIIAALRDIQVENDSNWNRRYRENMLRLKSGDLMEVARVMKGLILRDEKKGLSTGERKMLHSAKQILISEIVLSQNASYEEIEGRINMALTQ
jgi:CarD family transcriptional regulator